MYVYVRVCVRACGSFMCVCMMCVCVCDASAYTLTRATSFSPGCHHPLLELHLIRVTIDVILNRAKIQSDTNPLVPYSANPSSFGDNGAKFRSSSLMYQLLSASSRWFCMGLGLLGEQARSEITIFLPQPPLRPPQSARCC